MSVQSRVSKIIKVGLRKDSRAVQQLTNAVKSEQSIPVKAVMVWALQEIGSLKAVECLIDELQFEEEYESFLNSARYYQWELESRAEHEAMEYWEAQEAEALEVNQGGEEQDCAAQFEVDRYLNHDSERDEVVVDEPNEDLDDYEYKQNSYEMAGPDDDQQEEVIEQELDVSEDTETIDEPSLTEENPSESDPQSEDYVLHECTTLIASPADVLTSLGWQVLGPLNAALHGESTMIKGEVVKILGFFVSSRKLLEALNDENEIVRANAVEAIGAVFDLYYEPLLTSVEDKSSMVRASTISVMSRYNYPRAFSISIKEGLDDVDVVRAAAARGLGQLEGAEAIPLLIQALNDRNEAVRVNAGNTLVEIGTQAIEPLVTALIKEFQFRRELAGSEDRSEGDWDPDEEIPL